MSIMAKLKDRKISVIKVKGTSQERIWSILTTAVLLSFYFIYFLFRIDPQLIYQAQEPVFFFDKHYFYEFFHYPGGVNELFSNFLSQFFYYSWTGALLLSIVFGLITWNTKALIRSFDADRPVIYLHWIPSIFLLALHSNYRFPFVFTLGLFWILIVANIYIRIAPKNQLSRFLFYIFVHTVTYYLIAGQVVIFSAIIITYEVLYRRRIILPLLYIIFAGVLPYIGASYLFILDLENAYTAQLTSNHGYKVTWVSWVLYAFFPFVSLLIKFGQKYVKIGKNGIRNIRGSLLYSRSLKMRFAKGIILTALIVASCLYSYNKDAKAFFLINHYAHFEQWDKVIAMGQKGLPINNIVECQINRALYHSGCLCDKLFSVPQLFEGHSLFMLDDTRSSYSLQHSDVFFDLCLLNTSEQWAYEAIAARGDTAWNIQRLALINLLKENNDIAAKYLKMLRKTLWLRNWAIEHQKYLSNSKDLWENPQYQRIKNTIPASNFLVSYREPELCLEELLNNTKNKMAFEYFMAYCLLDGEISQFIKHLNRMNDFNYPKIPRHFEEAMLIYIQLTGRKDIIPPGKKVSKETIIRFNEFNQITAKYRNNKNAAYNELKKFRDTYWFYGLYYYQNKE